MGQKKRWYMATEQEVEKLRKEKTTGKVRRLLSSAGTSVLMTGPLIACNPKGGMPTADTGKASYMDYACTTEQIEDDAVVKCCLPDGDTSDPESGLDSGEAETATPVCDDDQVALGAEARCCPPDAEPESDGAE